MNQTILNRYRILFAHSSLNLIENCMTGFLTRFTMKIFLRPKQREFARRNLSYTVMSKRKLLELVQNGTVSGWDDPRMPTISGLRRRGYTAESIRKFSDIAGIAKPR